MESSRQDIVKRTSDAIWEKESLLNSDIEKESQAREESLSVIRECVSSDFPNLEQSIQLEVTERENADQIMAGSLESTLLELTRAATQMTDERED